MRDYPGSSVLSGLLLHAHFRIRVNQRIERYASVLSELESSGNLPAPHLLWIWDQKSIKSEMCCRF